MVAGQQARFLHLLDVAAHGLRRHLQLLGQFFDRHGQVLAHGVEQAALAGIEDHGAFFLCKTNINEQVLMKICCHEFVFWRNLIHLAYELYLY